MSGAGEQPALMKILSAVRWSLDGDADDVESSVRVTSTSLLERNLALPRMSSRLAVSLIRFSLPPRKVLTMSRFRLRMASILSFKDEVLNSMPRSFAPQLMYAERPDAIIVLVGVHPSLMHVPPTCVASTRAVLFPDFAKACARGVPPCLSEVRTVELRRCCETL